MEYNFKTKIGQTDFVFKGEFTDIKAFFKQVSALRGLSVPKCRICDSTSLWVNFRHVDGFDYYSVRCNACQGEFKFGQLKDNSGLFPKSWEKYEPKDSPPADEPGPPGPGF